MSRAIYCDRCAAELPTFGTFAVEWSGIHSDTKYATSKRTSFDVCQPCGALVKSAISEAMREEAASA